MTRTKKAESTIRKLTSRRKLAHIKLSRKAVRYSERAVLEFIQSKTIAVCTKEYSNGSRTKQRMSKGVGCNDDVNSIIGRAKKEVLKNVG